MAKHISLIAGCFLLFTSFSSLAADPVRDLPSVFSNKDSVGNTRHNLSQRQADGSTEATARYMDLVRNDYNEVCVYCHTPHGANSTTTAPLWNRTLLATTYTTYTSMSIEGTVGTPGANSLTCLSCHDGKVAIDSVINMPGSGKYRKEQETTESTAFLNTWGRSPNSNILPTTNPHGRLNPNYVSCLLCHTPDSAEAIGSTDFTAFALGTDLSNDHPIGVPYRGLTAGTDYNSGTTPSANGKLLFFDSNGNSRADKEDVRFYDTGNGYEVECASCHDPHGVPSGGSGSVFNATFLRIANTGSALCLTCHAK